MPAALSGDAIMGGGGGEGGAGDGVLEACVEEFWRRARKAPSRRRIVNAMREPTAIPAIAPVDREDAAAANEDEAAVVEVVDDVDWVDPKVLVVVVEVEVVEADVVEAEAVVEALTELREETFEVLLAATEPVLVLVLKVETLVLVLRFGTFGRVELSAAVLDERTTAAVVVTITGGGTAFVASGVNAPNRAR